jgi:adenine-specific DNA-methyltransferase
MTQNLLNDLESLLSKDKRFVVDGNLLKNKIMETALKDDPELLDLLLSEKKIKEFFFISVKQNLIFKKTLFLQFLNNKNFLPDSYTYFKNKIGLTSNNEYLKQNKEVVLSFPYKDNILEGGLTKEDEKTSRSEIFWSEILAPDEVDRLLEPKVLDVFKRISKNGEKKITEINPNDNLIIRGNNLLALHSLKKKFFGQINLIYIDPPYNTGTDSFAYNDRFNHSSWLTFMKNRLEIAYLLLHDQGSIFISIDQNELGYILVLMDELFGSKNRRNIITIKRSAVSGAKVINPGVVNVSEYVIIYSKSEIWTHNLIYRKRNRDDRYSKFIENNDQGYENWKFITILDALSKKTGIEKSKLKKHIGADYVKKIDEFVLDNIEKIVRFADMDENSVSKEAVIIKKKSLKQPNKIFHLDRGNKDDYYIQNGQVLLFYKDRVKEIDGQLDFVEPLSDIWQDVLPNDLHNEGGVKLKKGKKPEKLIGRIIEIATNKNDLVLDFFLGSGTTTAVAHKLSRRYIGIEQIDYGENDCVVRLKNTIDGEQSGISKSVNWSGGGDFVYCELMKLNQKFVSDIQKAKTKKELQKIWKLINEKGFLSYKLDLNEFNKNMSDFDDLDLSLQKKFLFEVLDKNQLYVNYSEINDVDYKISPAVQEFNKKFYSEKII